MSQTSLVVGRLSAIAAIGLLAWLPGPASPEVAAQQQAPPRPAGWTDASHGDRVRPDYARVFSTDAVHDIRIVIPRDRFDAMQADLQSLTPGFPRLGGPGPIGGPPGNLPPGFPAGVDFAAQLESLVNACSEKAAAASCTNNGVAGQCTAIGGGPLMCLPDDIQNLMAGRGGRGRGMNFTARDPMQVPVTVHVDGRVWHHVAMRYKGNSSLMSAVASGNGKVPFRLDFDQYEADRREIRNQRFYGFDELTFSSNTGDESQLREAFATEVLRDRGVPAARAAFYRVSVDTGSGAEYWGLYTMIEDPSDGAMLDAQFGSRSGNLYKPDGQGATWMAFDRESFPKKSNEDKADFTDIEGAIKALHAPRTDVRAWRAALESRFDVDLFLRWLAVNTTILNWDAYGAMPHNYYLYGDPKQNGRLRWIPWDHNFSLGATPGMPGGRGFMRGAPPPGGAGGFGGGPPANGPGPGAAPLPFPPPGRGGPFMGGFGRGGGDVLHAQVGSNWPLIQILLSDDVYARTYRDYLRHSLEGLFAPDAAAARLRQLHAVVAPAALAERATHTTISSREAFERAVDGPDGLVAIVQGRHRAVRTALDGTAAR